MIGRSVVSAAVLTLVLSLQACGDSTGVDQEGLWLGDWVQVNFLSVDDGGAWDQDIPGGIGFVASISESQWVETDDDGAGCAITFEYSVGGDLRFSKTAVGLGSGCPAIPIEILPPETGRLEFSNGGDVMIEWFDLQPGDDIEAFKWVRR